MSSLMRKSAPTRKRVHFIKPSILPIVKLVQSSYNVLRQEKIETLRVSLFCVALVYRLIGDRHWCFFLDYLSGKEPKGRLVTEIARRVELTVKHEEWRTEYMTLLQRDREKFAEGMAQGNILAIQRLLKKKMDNDFILSLGYTQEEIDEAEKRLLTTV